MTTDQIRMEIDQRLVLLRAERRLLEEARSELTGKRPIGRPRTKS